MRTTGKLIALFFALLFAFADAKGQNYFETKYVAGCNSPSALCEAADGGFAICGMADFSNYGIIIKLDSAGNGLWEKSYHSGTDGELFDDIVCTPDKGFAACGSASGGVNGLSKVIVVKTDSNGNVMWSRLLGDSLEQVNGMSIKTTIDNKLIVSGFYQGGGGPALSLDLLDMSGNLLWSKKYGQISQAWYIGEVITCSDKGFLITQGIRDTVNSNSSEIYVVKTDSTGNIDWTRTFKSSPTGQNGDFGQAVREVANQHYRIAASSSDNLLMLELDRYGNIYWKRYYGFGGGTQWTMTIDNTSNNGSIVTFFNDKNPAGPVLIKVDSLGSIQWAKTYGNPDDRFVDVVTLKGDKGWAAVGSLRFFANNTSTYYMYFVKTDTVGRVGCDIDILYIENPITIYVDSLTTSSTGHPVTSVQRQSSSINFTPHTLCGMGYNDPEQTPLPLSISPNPSTGHFSISSPEKIASVEIFDVLGNSIAKWKVDTENFDADISNRTKGIYFVKVTGMNGHLYTQKLIVH